MKKLFLLVTVLTVTLSAFAQSKKIELYRGNTVVFSADVATIDSVKFAENTTPEEVGVLINGIRWATCNVDAPGTFADTPESAGMFYQWNRKVGWSSTEPLVNSDGGTTWDNFTTPSGTEWEPANDPCPSGWRVPTTEEQQSLLSSGSSWTTQNGVKGRIFGSGSNTVFLPAAGHRLLIDGTLSNADTSGYYFSCTQYGIYDAYILNFFSSHTLAGVIGGRGYGFSVRCVQAE